MRLCCTSEADDGTSAPASGYVYIMIPCCRLTAFGLDRPHLNMEEGFFEGWSSRIQDVTIG